MISDNEKFNMQVKPNSAFLNELKSKLPEFFDREGNFDLDKFKGQLKEHNINELSDGYQLNFIGKDYARRQSGEMPSTVIVPDEEQNNGEGKDSKNLFFTGDNLEVLRHLQNNYAGKIDVIYIDPPYNTGKDGFVYPDNFEYSDEKIKDMFGIDDVQVERLKNIQGKSSHSAWLTFIYPRLKLAKILLNQNGIIFISIDSNEYNNLTEICDEIFGNTNLVGNLIIKTATDNNPSQINIEHEYMVCYAINKNNLKNWSVHSKPAQKIIEEYVKLKSKRLTVDEIQKKLRIWIKKNHKALAGVTHYNNVDDKGVYSSSSNSSNTRPGDYMYNIYHPVTGRPCPKPKNGWRWPKATFDEYELKGEVAWGPDETTQPHIKKRIETAQQYLRSVIEKDNRSTTNDLASLFEGKKIFDNPKPVDIIKDLMNFTTNSNAIVLDFFAGSSTTADAVMQLNAEDGGNRKFIMVQLPEKTYTVNSDSKEVPTKGGKAAYEAGFKSIDEISRERIRRAAAKIKADNDLTLPKDFDGSFKHYRVVNPTKQTLEDIEDFDPDNTTLFTDMVDSFSSKGLDVAGDATGEQTILTTWLAKDGYSFDANIKKIDFDGYEASLVEDSRLYIIKNGWFSENTKALLNKIGTHQITVQTIVLFGYSFNIADLRELEIGLKQLDGNINLLKRY
ncbi:site-specific DNA-methyltransferase [Ligilactobacillus salivarius]|uniref:Site-specific DNA-methyltransferase n=1 Tax=Ligilactobacillus salivarius TaxID=1624 RepID=A0AAW6Q683_9LACO|nr:site-specific DNA-methyltransferase [Ligilactobacillus salivarius]MBC6925312.1 site-specific DNA-methyltransferase [Ligilactobacillus salivarius]MDF4186881.1 site-specific DNA-methyltransferase [Ligilactobacillus salivarius]